MINIKACEAYVKIFPIKLYTISFVSEASLAKIDFLDSQGRLYYATATVNIWKVLWQTLLRTNPKVGQARNCKNCVCWGRGMGLQLTVLSMET